MRFFKTFGYTNFLIYIFIKVYIFIIKKIKILIIIIMCNITPNKPCSIKCSFPACLNKRKNFELYSPKSYFSFPNESSRYVNYVHIYINLIHFSY